MGVLRIAADYGCEERLGNELLAVIANHKPLPTLKVLQECYLGIKPVPAIPVRQQDLAGYDRLLRGRWVNGGRVMPETIELLLKELKLPAFGRHYHRHQEQAVENGYGHVRYLSGLCEQEMADRYQQRVLKWTREAKLPAGKSFASFILTELSATVQQQVIALKEHTDWASRAGNVLLIGPSGVGKSHIAAAIAHQLIEQAIRVKWFSAVALVQSLQQAKRDLELISAMTRLDKYQVLVIDDIGYVKKTDAETQVLFEFIAHRYESGSLIITANQPFSHWDHIFPDTMMTVAAIDRIIHHSTIIEIEGESYRKKKSIKN